MPLADPYVVLGVEPTASTEEIRAAFRAEMHRLHPDHESGASTPHESITAITEAWAILRDPDRRAALDRQRISRPDRPTSAVAEEWVPTHERTSHLIRWLFVATLIVVLATTVVLVVVAISQSG